jgi:hypothetical protein
MKLKAVYDYFARRYGSRPQSPEAIEIDDIDFQQILAKDGKIAVIWSTEDVQGVLSHLTDDQAWEVLEEVGRQHDALFGINWTTLEIVADDLFPQPTKQRRRS